MRSIFIRLWLCALLVLAAGAARAADLVWLTDLGRAQAQAAAEKKFVLLVFHGSDWCPPCIEMQRQVFQAPAFMAYARQVLVLVDVDFPEKSEQSAELKRANLALRAKFNVGEGYPTLVLLNDDGETVFQELGYYGGGPAEVLSKLERHIKPPAPTVGSTGFKNVDVGEFAKLASDKANTILDVRTRQEYEAGHLAGAVNIDINAPDFAERIKALDKSKTYLVHCAGGVRSAKACQKLAQLEFPNLYNLSGGINAWVKAGQPVEK